MLQTLINAFKVKEIRRKVYMMLLLLLVFRIGCFIPVPGLDRGNFETLFTGESANDFLTLMSSITGGALAQGTLFALGIGPYINASIIMQLLSVGIPALERLSKQGEEGRKKIAQYTRYVTILLAIIQSVGIIISFANSADAINTNLFFDKVWVAGVFMAAVYTAGAFIVMWLGERITDYGVGNGQSMIIFVGILSTAGAQIVNKITQISTNPKAIWDLLFFIIVSAVIFFAIIYVDLSERKVPVQYAKQTAGGRQFGGARQYIPLKVNAANVMPIIFAQAIMFIPITLIGFSSNIDEASGFVRALMDHTSFWYNFIFFVLILVFTYFYTAITINPTQMAEDMKRNNGFIPGIKPGKNTAEFIDTVMSRITLPGSVFLGLIAILPAFAGMFGVQPEFAQFFGGTSLLILVGVVLDTLQQVESHLLMRHYDGLLSSGRIKGRSGVAAY